MDAWMNRCRLFAECVMVMGCSVLLPVAIDKVDLKSQHHGSSISVTMLVIAAVTSIAGICPFLVCSLSKAGWLPATCPHAVTKWLAPLSSTCLVALACWMIRLIILGNWAYPAIGALIGLCILVRTVRYCRSEAAEIVDAEYLGKLEDSLEFSSGIAALLFVGLEGLALEGGIGGLQNHLDGPMGASFVVCLLSVCLMLVQTVPPRDIRWNLPEISDILMVFEVFLVMFFILHGLVKLRALLLFAAPFLIFVMHLFGVAVDEGALGNDHNEEYKPASLELTKVTFVGFLAVSIMNISKDSLDKSTECFLHLAAAAIVSGIIWRRLTHIRSYAAAAAGNHASFCTHLFVVIATVPFTIMARKAPS